MIKRISLLRRKSGMTSDEFWAHYAGPHAAIVRSLPGVRAVVLARPVGAHGTAWDAVGEVWFDSVADLERAFQDPETVARLQADRALFVDGLDVVIVEEQARWSLPAESRTAAGGG